MKATALSHEMAKAISAANVAIPTNLRNQSPCLGGIMISTETKVGLGRISFLGTNLEQTIAVEVDANIEERGHCLVPAGHLVKLVKALGKGREVLIESDDQNIVFTCEGTIVSLKLMREDEWPTLPEVEGEVFILTLSEVEEVRRILHAVSPSDPRYNGVLTCVHFDKGRVEATDSYRYARVEIPHSFPSALVTGPAVRSALESTEEVLVLKMNTTHFSASTHYGEWISVLQAAEFVPTGRLVRPSSEHKLVVQPKLLSEPLARAIAISGNDEAWVDLSVTDDELTLYSYLPDLGEVTDVVPCTGTFAGRMRFNVKVLRDGLDAARSDEVTLETNTDLEPIIFHAGCLTEVMVGIRIGKNDEHKQKRAK